MKKFVMAVLILIFSSSATIAADNIFDKIDKNKDGKISKKEYLDAVNKTFKSYDKNGDQILTKDELEAIDIPDFKNFMKETDINNDGIISKQEFINAAEKRFKLFDKNNDGYIDKNEWDAEMKRINPNNPIASPVSPFISVSF